MSDPQHPAYPVEEVRSPSRPQGSPPAAAWGGSGYLPQQGSVPAAPPSGAPGSVWWPGRNRPILVALAVALVAVLGAAAAALAASLVVASAADDIGEQFGRAQGEALGDAAVEASGSLVDSLFDEIEEMESAYADDYASAEGYVESYGPTVPAEEQSEPVPPQDLGDDPDLDAYAQACFEGDYVSCDDLYYESKAYSEYERYAMTCGGRVKPEYGGYCTELE